MYSTMNSKAPPDIDSLLDYIEDFQTFLGMVAAYPDALHLRISELRSEMMHKLGETESPLKTLGFHSVAHCQGYVEEDITDDSEKILHFVKTESPKAEVFEEPVAQDTHDHGDAAMGSQQPKDSAEISHVKVAGVIVDAGECYTTYDTAMTSSDAAVLRAEFARLKLSSDVVIVAM
jgi:hypothetical protein